MGLTLKYSIPPYAKDAPAEQQSFWGAMRLIRVICTRLKQRVQRALHPIIRILRHLLHVDFLIALQPSLCGTSRHRIRGLDGPL